jgi:hypothetical protein
MRAPNAVLARLFVLMLLAVPVVALATPSTAEVKKTLKTGDQAAVGGLLTSLHGQLDADIIKAILTEAPRLKTLGVYDGLITAMATARGPALDELVKGYKKQRRADVRFLIVDALGKVPEAPAEGVLFDALKEDDDETVAVLAARQLGKRATASAVEGLIPVLEAFEKEADRARLVREVNGALAALTGQELVVAVDWKNYWDAHKAEYQPPAQDGEAGSQTRDRNAIDRMRRERPADLRTMERMRDDDVIVVKSQKFMDEVEKVLTALNVKHKLVEKAEFETLTLDPTRQVIVFQCPGKDRKDTPQNESVQFSDATIAKVREFVARGGYMISSDLQLGYVLARAFPEVITHQGTTSNRDKEPAEITISPHPSAVNHPLMRDVFPLGSWTEQQFTWQLFMTCDVAAPNPGITELVTSSQMADLSQGLHAVAFTFTFPPTAGGGGRVATGGGRGRRPGGGVVLHVLSHWKLQEKDEGDGFALQQILLNLIVEKQERRKAEARGD